MFSSTGVPSQLDELPSGDFAFLGNGPNEEPVSIGIERKVIQDFISSFTSGRLMAEQLPKLCEHHHYPYLLLEGNTRRNADNGAFEHYIKGAYRPPKGKPWQWQDIDHILTTITTHFPVRLLRTYDDRETVAMTVSLYRYFCRPWESHGSFNVFHTPPPPVMVACRPDERSTDEEWQRWVCRLLAKELPGIGWQRSGDVANEFLTARSMISASAKRWLGIEGIGDKTVARVMRALGGRL